ncbi:Fur family transcriptional regulator, zinc uptake regulator/Fur family transcriptional regulator, ferric uptake regulator [Caldicoprobacter faecalis]|uniref:Fur family transcriptional regulator, zinc uptake regulator/Fur family transcriptional regulator, ferric uptake regulator n=2 Tax=Caldicoprobacter faecalis TaxID=937334 RepID=A0A1I5TUQ2_9FIRM|nr:Fur family transcriptional regulator, zinc uptake regulator/Fur family transcriptional regulator, ferric uptake regulator [Caldicoprobacter faecalis]
MTAWKLGKGVLWMGNKNEFTEQLKQRGYKLTKQRQAILDVFMEMERPLATAQHIFEKVMEINPGINFSTVYRNLDMLVQEGIVRKITFDQGAAYYELMGGKHHHHLICKGCGKIQCVDYCPLRDMPIKEGFVPTDHSFEIFGFCKECMQTKLLEDERRRERE